MRAFENADLDGVMMVMLTYGPATGLLLSTGMVKLMSGVAGSGFDTWEWRVPSLASIVLVGIGLYVRLRVDSGHGPARHRVLAGLPRHAVRAASRADRRELRAGRSLPRHRAGLSAGAHGGVGIRPGGGPAHSHGGGLRGHGRLSVSTPGVR